jgi:hypothetical protein
MIRRVLGGWQVADTQHARDASSSVPQQTLISWHFRRMHFPDRLVERQLHFGHDKSTLQQTEITRPPPTTINDHGVAGVGARRDITTPPQMIMMPMLPGAHTLAHNESNHLPVSARIAQPSHTEQAKWWKETR